MSNRTFSIKKGRELSTVEAQIASIRKRLKNHLGRRDILDERSSPTAVRKHSAAMPPNRKQRREADADWEASGTEENYVNVSGSNTSSNRDGVSGVGERGDDSGNNQTNGHASGGGVRRSRKSQQNHQPGLGPWTGSVAEVVQSMAATHRAIKTLEEQFASHMEDIREMDGTRTRLTQLEEQCRNKDREITMQENTITTLKSMDLKVQATIDQKIKELDEQKKLLDQERLKQDRRTNATLAEQELQLNIEKEKRDKQRDREIKELRENLNNEFARKKNDIDKKVTALEAEKQQLSAKVEEQGKTLKNQSQELEKTTEQCDILERAKDSVKSEKLGLDRELKMMKEEFALTSRSKDYFEKGFVEICGTIEGISFKYFNDIDGKDPDELSDELVKADSQFRSVPIDDTEDSQDLRAANAQRIISGAICDTIWKPFSSEFTLLHPGLDEVLNKLSEELHKSSPGGRAANVWTALTTRALESLPANVDSTAPRASGSKDRTEATCSTRADSVISKVLNVLSPLVHPSQREDLRKDLLALANSAIDIWNNAQTGELRIIVNSSLKPERREEWRSEQFDPVLPSLDRDEPNFDTISRTRPRIITLFPQVIAREVTHPVKHGKSMPGGWQAESEQAPLTIETCIHPGRGLPEWSPLLVRGKELQEEKSEYFMKALEEAKKKLQSRRILGQGRRDSRGSSTAGPLSVSVSDQ